MNSGINFCPNCTGYKEAWDRVCDDCLKLFRAKKVVAEVAEEEDYLKPESRLALDTIKSMLEQLDGEEIEMMKDDLYNAIDDNIR